MGKLGLSIIGGSEHASRIFGEGRPGVYISKVSLSLSADGVLITCSLATQITVGGAADASEMLRLGDRILSVRFSYNLISHKLEALCVGLINIYIYLFI